MVRPVPAYAFAFVLVHSALWARLAELPPSVGGYQATVSADIATDRRQRGRHGTAVLLSLAAAFVGFLLLVAFLLVVDGPPVGWWPLLAFVVATPTLAALIARRVGLSEFEVWGYTFALVLLSWPVLGFLALLVRYWLTGQTIGN